MIVLDTHAWLWWASDRRRLSPHARQAIDGADRLGVCTISAWEVALLVEHGRIALDRDVRAWVRQALALERVQPLTLADETAVDAALLEREQFGADPADRIIFATARRAGAQLVTKDEAMRRFDPARTLW